MTTSYLQLTAHDPIVARDGRPFGVNQGQRMRSLGWPYPSVVAGSFRTALVKAAGGDFTGDTPQKLMNIAVAGIFPVAAGTLYLPAPHDCVVHPDKGPLRVYPQDQESDGCDFPNTSLRPVMLTTADAKDDFKPKQAPAWWPAEKFADWLTGKAVAFDRSYLAAAATQVRDHVQLEAHSGAAAENRLFATVGLSLTHLPRFGALASEQFTERFTAITLAARAGAELPAPILHPLGGERRLVHWQTNGSKEQWQCPGTVRTALEKTQGVRLTLATPAVFKQGWRPGWLDETTLSGRPSWWPEGPTLKLVGVCIPRWKAVSGWSLAEPRGPKPVKRLVPAGGVYYFETSDNTVTLAEQWLQPVSDDEQDRKDGFGLAVWGVW